MLRFVMPLPALDFDPTESAVPWQVLTAAGHELVFATADGQRGHADERMLTGRGLGPWRPLLRARSDAVAAYRAMEQAPAFLAPRPFEALPNIDADGVIFPGGHAPGMRPYLEDERVQALAVRMLGAGKQVGAICHGALVVARAKDPATGRSVLHGRRTTALLQSMELSAWLLTRLWLGAYYRTYPETVEAEVTRNLESPAHFERGPFAVARDAPDRLDRGFVVRDRNYLSARWPGDAYRFAHALLGT